MYRITKEFTFDMAHRLMLDYDSQCQRVHGHTYRVLVTLSDRSINHNGMVKDFSSVKKDFEQIKALFDHQLVLNDKDEEMSCQAGLLMDGNPTAENMARFILEKLLEVDPRVCKVTVYETPTSYAEYEA